MVGEKCWLNEAMNDSYEASKVVPERVALGGVGSRLKRR